MAVMPMFPLGSVLLPGEILPLHVFEPRYRRLVIDLLASEADEPEFGVTLIERGHEVGGGDARTTVGTVARIVQVEAFPDDRYGVVAVGMRRIQVNAWLPDDPYPLADVDDWPDTDADETELSLGVASALERVRHAHALAVELGDLPEGIDVDVGPDPVLASYQLVSLSPLGAADRQRLLGAESPSARLEVLDDVLDDVEAMLAFRRG
jgi:Lon protease-like protein